ncbi:unnamed protein product [Symbiodinium natans]|uniref:EcxA zinc-binding domain-containing protein n=1 Tax=Symbiodinium natans TaxID=878477 RepID=A0A812SCZ5_9DINO|nr:unnamed protein product [Symbiodinium natans]
MFRLFIAVFSSALTVLVARTAHGGCIAPVLLQRQQALSDHATLSSATKEPTSKRKEVSATSPALHATVNFNSTKVDLAGPQGGADPADVHAKKGKDAEEILKILKDKLDKEADVCKSSPTDAFVNVIQGSAANIDTVSLDMTNAFADGEVLEILVTAMTMDGAYVEGSGFWAALGESTATRLVLQLDRVRSVIDIYQPPTSFRTTDRQSQAEVALGVGDGWLDVLPLQPCAPPMAQKVIVDASQMVSQMFFTYSLQSWTSYRIVEAEAFPQNFDIVVEYLSSPAPVILGFSVVQLPAVPMKPRLADDRLLYFTTDFLDVGYHRADVHTLPSEAVDREMSLIWRWDLAKLPNRTIRMHVDPTVPLRWQMWVKEGIEAWNSAFQALRMPASLRAVLPGDDDWPQDYSMADARYNSIYWTLSDEISSIGVAQVDPRTGEILKADISMSGGWVWAWLSELDLLTANTTHQDRLALLAQGAKKAHPHRPNKRRMVKSHTRHDDIRSSPPSAETGHTSQLPQRGTPGPLLLSMGQPLTALQLEVLMGEGLKSVVMHEMGHILGLRHNFKGSTAISQKCLQNRSCTAVHGLSASIMDYLPMNLPQPGREPNSVHIFPPTIGAYDKLAIRYGYSEPSDSPADAFYGLGAMLEEAKAFDVCYDADEELGEDPFCMAEDLGEDPVAFHEQRLKRIAQAQSELHKRYVQADGPWRNYGKSLSSLLREAEFAGHSLIAWVGGIRNSYAHRGAVWNASKARRPVPLQMQRRALEALLKLLRPDTAGLLPPAEALPFAVTGEEDSLSSLDLVRLSEKLIKELLGKLLSSERLLQVRKQELLLDQNAPENAALTVEEFLTRLSDGILGGFHLNLGHEEASAPRTAEMTLQLEFVRGMTALYHEKELPASLEAQLLLQLRQLRRDTAAAEQRLQSATAASKSMEWPTLLEVHVTLLSRELASALCRKGNEECKDSKSAGQRVTSHFPALALAFMALASTLC